MVKFKEHHNHEEAARTGDVDRTNVSSLGCNNL